MSSKNQEAIKMALEKMDQSTGYEKEIIDGIYSDLKMSSKTAALTDMAIEAGIDTYLSNQTVKIASLEDLFAFDRVDKSNLIHKSTRDLWNLTTDKDGNVQITRLFDNEGEPIKG